MARRKQRVVQDDELLFRENVKLRYLAGLRGYKTIAEALGDVKLERRVKRVLESAEFQREVLQAQRDVAQSVRDRVEKRAHAIVDEIEALAFGSSDKRVKLQALLALLDRGGMTVARQIEVGPSSWAKLIAPYLEDDTT